MGQYAPVCPSSPCGLCCRLDLLQELYRKGEGEERREGKWEGGEEGKWEGDVGGRGRGDREGKRMGYGSKAVFQ